MESSDRRDAALRRICAFESPLLPLLVTTALALLLLVAVLAVSAPLVFLRAPGLGLALLLL